MKIGDSLMILGRQPKLGLVELESLFGAKSVVPAGGHAAIATLPPAEIDFERLGGSTRLAQIVAIIPSSNWKIIEKQLQDSVVELANSLPEGKIKLGLSVFGVKISPAKLNATGLTLKKIIRSKTDRSVRLVPNPELELNTAQVLHNNLTGPTGIELLIVAVGEKTMIARTLSVQDIASYRVRDRERPKRDAKVGMLPPKLAQIIINLAVGRLPADLLEVIKTSTSKDRAGISMPNLILDPFCGTGVLLQEAMLMGYDIYGYDSEPRMIEYSRANLKWLDEIYGVAHGGKIDMHYNLGVGDATNSIYRSTHTVPIDVVASETYLGRPFTSDPSTGVLEKTVSECNLIIKKFLANIHTQLTPSTRLCLAIPAWQIKPNQFKHLPLLDNLREIGYNRVKFEHIQSEDLLYYREDQLVARELLVLTRK